MIDYLVYNDYELLYLIAEEGSQEALDIMFKKYDKLIYKQASRIYPYGDKMQDLVQEGRMVLSACISHYNSTKEASFYTYFLISLRRRLFLLTNSDYYSMRSFSEDREHPDDDYSNDAVEINLDLTGFSIEERRIFRICIMDGMSIREYSMKYNLKYHAARKLYNNIICRLKRVLSID